MLNRLPLRTKLVVLALVPLLAVLTFAGLRVRTAFAAADGDAMQRAELIRVDSIIGLAVTVGDEARVQQYESSNEQLVQQARDEVDFFVEEFLDNPGSSNEALVELVEKFSARLPALREAIPLDPSTYREIDAKTRDIDLRSDVTAPFQSAVLLTPAEKGIVDAVDELETFKERFLAFALYDRDLLVDTGIAIETNNVTLIERYIEALRAESDLYAEIAELPANEIGDAVTDRAIVAGADTEAALNVLADLAAGSSSSAVTDAAESDLVQQIVEVRETFALSAEGEVVDIDPGIIERRFEDAELEMRSVEAELSGVIIEESAVLENEARNQAASTLLLTALFALLLIAGLVLIYRSIRRPLRTVTERSLAVANEELPAVVKAMRTDIDADLPEIERIEVQSNDEIGELISAFNQMSSTAVELAGEQAAARRSVGDMFMNLGRRNQKMLNRLLRKLDGLQRNEQDPEALEALFEVDSMVTRMRRNTESLLVLAGVEQTRRFSQPVPAGDVIRAALSEVEGFDRVETAGDGSPLIRGEYVADVAHLLAELIENALVFSPPQSSVEVASRLGRDGCIFAVSDNGVGMSDERLEEINRRIELAATQEETPSKFLGMFVVGRLATRRGAEVKLFDRPTGGIAARVLLPRDALHIETSDAVPTELPARPAEAETAEPALDVQPTPERDDHPASTPEPITPDPEPVATPVMASAEAGAEVGVSSSETPDPDAPLNRFGTKTRIRGAQLPQTTIAKPSQSMVGDELVDRDPDMVRQSLSSFQSGTGRADNKGRS